MSFLSFLKNITLVIASVMASVTIAITATPATSAIATLKNPHQKPHQRPKAEQTLIVAGGSSQIIALPDTGVQNDGWSCGPNSAARILRYYGHDVDYVSVRAATDKKLFLPQKMRNPLNNQWIEMRTGTPPLTLQQVMQRWEGDRVRRSSQSSLNKLINLVRSGKPAIALIRVGSLKIPYVGSIPNLHWIAVTGADSRQIYYTDTNSQHYSLSHQDFQTQWNLGLDQDMSGAIANILKNNGVEARTLVWVER
jgi:uncharacterized protein YvpB